MVTLRKNGLLSSCEPCRKSKLRCDHRFPICTRCARTNKQDRCIYRPSPMTGQSRRTDPGYEQPRSEEMQVPRSVSEMGVSAGPSRLVTPSPSGVSGGRRLSQPGFLGLTSYDAALKDSRDYLGISALGTAEKERERAISLSEASNATSIELDQVHQGARLLLLLRDFHLYKDIAEMWFRTTNGCDPLGRPIMVLVFQALEENLIARLPDLDLSQLLTLSSEVFQLFNNRIPVHPLITIHEYITCMSYRWEIIGMVFAFVGFGTFMASDWDAIFQRQDRPVISRNDLQHLAMSAVETCVKFCEEAGIVNDPVSWLVLLHTHLSTLVYGDGDHRSWRALGDLSTIIFTLGFNQPASDNDTPFWLSEMRKRLMGASISFDKQLATFLGRPPRISSRFCNTTLPLDLSFEEIVAEPSIRDAAISKLDANGWNTDGSTAKAMWARIPLLMGHVREDILELSLNNHIEDLPRKVNDILQTSHRVWASLPSFLHWKQDLEDHPGLNATENAVIYLHLDYLYNDFLLYRILSKRTNTWSEDLVQVSHEILGGVLSLVENRMRTTKASGENSWVISYFGLPTAGVLAIELVRRCSHLSPEAAANVAATSTIPFPRSRVIQNLSVFASLIKTVIEPHEGNYGICQKARETIRRVLDAVLSAENYQSVASMPTSNSNGNTGLELSNDPTLSESIVDYSYYISHLDNWQFELPNNLNLL
ncbi:hypothetical protein BO70DRAFT_336493 [Aspergillus heteromorphus CBS 117.55]|uniref:Zn(2)-C6 fungal-type domain-containing protein n=1 Tax=Aspergillus heteromorphus CBS 117.55 TaxID=1448321 RepID=A0A317WA09_9EURO|nr:uncharacterized protein BO70DRAFT_336493 [Aspergillus heteromorphus CBS 117.55]PWY82157.1 hypothetical protein BO70DRAFT_336493 [Aspergillus heteromorphus CBS 117.55]